MDGAEGRDAAALGTAVFGVDDLAAGLERLGLAEGVTVMVHASLRAVRPAGGADTLLDALAAVVGPTGSLVMVLGSPEGVVFDAATTPADPDMGTLAEALRTRPGTVVNDHPAARTAVAGPAAATLLEPTPWHDYYGPGSPMQRLAESGGQVLRFGADIDTVTVTHWAEHLADVADKRRVRRRYLTAAGEQWIESLDDCDGIVDWAGGDYFSEIMRTFLEDERCARGRVGGADAELFLAADLVEHAVEWLERTLGHPSAPA